MRLSFFLLLALLLVGLPVQAQNRYEQRINAQFSLLDLALNERGLVRSHTQTVDRLPRDGRDSFTLRLQAYKTYYFVGFCDEDCSDLDLVLYAPSGLQLRSDTERDDTPFIEYRPTSSGTYRVQAHMYACSTEPCYYGIGVYRE